MRSGAGEGSGAATLPARDAGAPEQHAVGNRSSPRDAATRRMVSADSHAQAPIPPWSWTGQVQEPGVVGLRAHLGDRNRGQLADTQAGVVAEEQDCCVTQALRVAGAGRKQPREANPPS